MSFDSFNYAPPGCPPCVQFPNEPCNGCKDCEGKDIPVRLPSDWPKTLSTKRHIARKVYKCEGGCEIQPGELYEAIVMLFTDDERRIETMKFCKACLEREPDWEEGK